jgi:hypothetical protein
VGVTVIAVGTFKKAVATLRLTSILLLCALYLPTPALPQSPVGMTRIGVLNPQGVPTSIEDGLRHGLRKVGYVEGRNVVIQWRRNAANREEMYTQASELAASGVDLIVAIGSKLDSNRKVTPPTSFTHRLIVAHPLDRLRQFARCWFVRLIEKDSGSWGRAVAAM